MRSPWYTKRMPEYTLHCGDCLKVLPDIESSSIDLIVTSPPYNCRKDYGAFDDQMPWPDYYKWMGLVLDECYRVLIRGGVIAVNVPGVVRWQSEHRHRESWCDFDPEYLTHRNGVRAKGCGRIEPIGFRLFDMMSRRDSHMREPITWVKGNEDGEAISTTFSMGSDNNPYMRPTNELILLGSKGQWFHRGGTGMRGRNAVPFADHTKDTWFVRPESHKNHPAIFPVEIPRRLIGLFTHAPDSVVLDPFCGLGTVGIASVELGRMFIGIDQNPKYISWARERIWGENAQRALPLE